MFQKNALNHFLVNFSTKNSLKSAKNVMFFILRFGWQANGETIAPPPPASLATLLLRINVLDLA